MSYKENNIYCRPSNANNTITRFTRIKTIYINEKDETNTNREKLPGTALERSVAKSRLGVKPGLLAPNPTRVWKFLCKTNIVHNTIPSKGVNYQLAHAMDGKAYGKACTRYFL